jgi:hypothetical protein
MGYQAMEAGNAMRVETTGQARGIGRFLGTGTHALV